MTTALTDAISLCYDSSSDRQPLQASNVTRAEHAQWNLCPNVVRQADSYGDR